MPDIMASGADRVGLNEYQAVDSKKIVGKLTVTHGFENQLYSSRLTPSLPHQNTCLRNTIYT